MAVMGIPDGSGRLVPRKASARSRVSNGGHILPDVDGRSAVARRYRDIAAQIIADMGGASQCAEARLQLIRRFAAAAVLAEQMEARFWQTAIRSHRRSRTAVIDLGASGAAHRH